MGDQDLQLRRSLSTHAQNIESQPPYGCHFTPKIESSPFLLCLTLSLLQTLYWKKVGLRVFRQILQTILSVVHIFSFIITTYLKTFSGMKTLSKKQRPAELSLWIITRVYPILPKMFPFLSSYLLPVPRIGCPVLLPNLWRKPCIRERSPPSSQKVLTFETRKIPITK